MGDTYKAIDAGSKGTVHIWKPSDSTEGTVVYVHGYFGKRDSGGKYPDYWKNSTGSSKEPGKVTLEEQFRRSGVNATFVVPRGAESDKDPASLFWPDLDALLDKAGADADKPVVIVGHSGAYRHYLAWMKNEKVRHLSLLDSTYFGEGSFPKFKALLGRAATLDIVSVTKGTRQHAKDLVAYVTKTSRVHKRTSLPESFADALSSEEKGTAVLYIEATYGHNPLVGDGKLIPFILRRAPIGAVAAADDAPPPPITPPDKGPPPKIESKPADASGLKVEAPKLKVVPAKSYASGQAPGEAEAHDFENPLKSKLGTDGFLVRLALVRDAVLKKGAAEADSVKQVRYALKKAAGAKLEEAGDFDDATSEAVKRFQTAALKVWESAGDSKSGAGVKADGVVNAPTLLALDAALAKVEGGGRQTKVPPTCPGAPDSKETSFFNKVHEAVTSAGNFEATPWAMNVVGIRGYRDGKRVENEPGKFNDTIAVLYKCDKGHKHAAPFLASVDPARRKDGDRCVHLADHQYVYKVEETSDGPVVVPKSKVWVWWDDAGDGVQHPDDTAEQGAFDIRILPNDPGDEVHDQDAGHQMIHGGKGKGSPWEKFVHLCQEDANGEFYYTLIDATILPGEDPIKDPTKVDAPKDEPKPGTLPEPVKGTPPVIADHGDPKETKPPFAEPTGFYWPVVTKLKKGREVAYTNTSGKVIGNPGRQFLASRSGGKRYHVGIDLWGDVGDPVVACENGKIVNFYHFYHGVYALIVQNDSGTVINYGEVHKDSLKAMKLKIGDKVKAGQQIGMVGKMTSDSMCHFEMYKAGTTANKRWLPGEKPPKELLNPTKYLLALATGKAPAHSEPEPEPDLSFNES